MSDFSMFQITHDQRVAGSGFGGWVKFYFVVADREFSGSAKLFDDGDGENNPNDYMGYGVQIASRVSKLEIRERGVGPVFEWDRGLNFSDLPEYVVEAVDEKLNELPEK